MARLSAPSNMRKKRTNKFAAQIEQIQVSDTPTVARISEDTRKKIKALDDSKANTESRAALIRMG